MQVTVQINGLNCSGYMNQINMQLKAISSVSKIITDLKSSTLKIVYNNPNDLSTIEGVINDYIKPKHECKNPNPCPSCKRNK